MEEVFGMAVGKTLDELPHQRLNVSLRELDETRIQKTHEIMITVLKHQVE